MTAATRGGGVRGDDRASIDSDRCTKTWRRNANTVQCEGLRVIVKNAAGKAMGFRCNRCSAQYDENGRRIRDE